MVLTMENMGLAPSGVNGENATEIVAPGRADFVTVATAALGIGGPRGNVLIPDSHLFQAVAACCDEGGRLLYPPAVRKLIGRYGEHVNQIPQEHRQEFLNELTKVTGRPLPAFKPTPFAAVVEGIAGPDTRLEDAVRAAAGPPAGPTRPHEATPSDTPKSESPAKAALDLIREHVRLIQQLAEPLKGHGKIVIACFGEAPDQLDPRTKKPGRRLQSHVAHINVGDVDHAAADIARLTAHPHHNVYMPLAVFRPDLPSGGKGFERDVIGCLGVIADFDDPEAARWAERLPMPPNYVLETSAGRFQAFYLFDKPEPVDAVKPVAERLKAFARCDHGTSDISHVWRVAGTLNWPNAKKVAEGRPREPQLVRVAQAWDGQTTRLQDLDAASPAAARSSDDAEKDQKHNPQNAAPSKRRRRNGQPHPAAVEGTPEREGALAELAFLPPQLQEEIKRPAEGDRSKALFRVIAKLIECGRSDDTIENLIYAHPNGIGEKYADRDDLDKEIARVRARTGNDDPIALLVAEMNEDYAVVDDNGKTVVVYRRKDNELNRKYVVRSSFQDFRNIYLNDRVITTDTNGNLKPRTKAEIWLAHPDRLTYKGGLSFLPGQSETPEGVFNLWAGWAVTPRPGDWSLMKAHIRDVICSGDQEHFEYVVNWMAKAVQEPATAGEVALVLRGERGTGKGAFARGFGRLFGQHFLHLSHARHLTGNFNAHLRDACLVFADEAFYAGDKQHEGQLKRLVTEPTLLIEGKYQNAVQVRNCLHVIVASNEEWVVPAGTDERRFFVLDVSAQRKKDFAYFNALENEAGNGGVEAMLHELLHHDLTGFNVRDVPATAALLDQKVLSLRGIEAWWFDILADGDCPGTTYNPEVLQDGQDWTSEIKASRDALYNDYLEFSKRMREYKPKTKEELGKFLRKFVPGLGKKRPRQEGNRSRIYILPPLQDCRAAFEREIGETIEWEQG